MTSYGGENIRTVEGLNAPQALAVTTRSGAVLVVAGAGSGKTKTLTSRIAYLIKERGVSPYNVLALTFTRKAAAEMRERLEKTLGPGFGKKLSIGTFHSISLRMLETSGSVLGYQKHISVYDEIDQLDILKSIVEELGLKVKPQDIVKELQSYASDCDKHEFEPEVAMIITEYRHRLKQYNAVDFTLLLTETLDMLRHHPGVFQHWHDKYKNIFVDEYQDSDRTQYYLHEALKPESIFVVGDMDQCQPGNTMIRMADGYTETPIEALAVGDKIMTYDRHGKVLLKNGVVSAISKRHYVGNIHTVVVGDKITHCTPNHKWLIRWLSGKEREVGYWCTYLMRKGDHFRVGKTKFFRSGGQSVSAVMGLAMRMRQEKADCAWVLKIHQTDMDASVYEEIVAANYGLPQACFLVSNNPKNFSQQALDTIFDSVDKQICKAVKCLTDHGREIDFPLVSLHEKRSRRTVQELRACNLLDGVMSVPVADNIISRHNRSGRWEMVSSSTSHYDGWVFSLDVKDKHKYVANGIVTCNSIYGWRGSDIEIIRDFEKRDGAEVIKLEQSYRCPINVVEAANNLISHNRDRFDKKLWTNNDDGDFEYYPNPDETQEARFIARTILEGEDEWGDIAVLTRKHSQHAAIAEALAEFGVSFKLIGAQTNYWKTAGARFMVSVLKVLHNSKDDWNFKRIARDLIYKLTEEQWLDLEIKSVKEKRRIISILLEYPNHFTGLMSWFQENQHLPLGSVILRIMQTVEIELYFTSRGLTTKALEYRNLLMEALEWERSNNEAPTVADFLGWLADQDVQSEIDNDDVVKLMTIHAAKGLEFPVVFLAGLNEEILPHGRSLRAGDIEEERRLCYVAITRTKDRLYLSSHASEESGQRTVRREPSRFLGEMNEPF